jgi:hypothetical protein
MDAAVVTRDGSLGGRLAEGGKRPFAAAEGYFSIIDVGYFIA